MFTQPASIKSLSVFADEVVLYIIFWSIIHINYVTTLWLLELWFLYIFEEKKNILNELLIERILINPDIVILINIKYEYGYNGSLKKFQKMFQDIKPYVFIRSHRN